MNVIKTMMLAVFVSSAARAEGDSAALAKEMKGVKVTLAQGLHAASKSGKPISGKFEVEDGKLQLSVYTAKDGSFSEVIVDHKTGKVAKTEPITGGDDLTAAKAQNDAMASATSSLDAAVKKAEKANHGYHAVSVVPAARDGKASAEVTLMKGTESKTVAEAL
jgi:hypothetical protein